jgi:hypothetical protein
MDLPAGVGRTRSQFSLVVLGTVLLAVAGRGDRLDYDGRNVAFGRHAGDRGLGFLVLFWQEGHGSNLL